MLSEKSRNKGFGKGTPKNSIFVGNLAYTLEENELEELFSKYGKVLDASIIKKKNKGPMGYAFVTMSTKEEVDRCFRELNGTIFQGRRINLGSDSSQTKLALENNLLSNSNSDKFKSANTPNPDEIIQRMNGIGEYMLFVGNISNNVTHREIKDLFSQYGDVSDVSILRKKDGSSKGTCLVTMTNKQEMERCVELLHNYSLKGLRLTVSVKLDSLKETEKVVHGTNSGGGNMSCSTNGKTFSEALKLNASTKDASEDSSTSKQNDTIEIKDVSRKPDVGSSDGAVNGGERGLLDEDSMKIIISQPDWKPNKALSKQDHTLVVGNLHIECEEKDLIEKFKPYGMVVFVKIVHNTAPGALGYAYLTMANQAEADFCMEELQGRELFGKKLCIGKSLQAITSTQQYEHSLLFRFNSSTTGSEHGVGNEVDLKSEVIEKEIKILFGSFYNNNPIEGVSVSKLFSDSDGKRGYGFIRFKDLESAIDCLQNYAHVLFKGTIFTLELSRSMMNQIGEELSDLVQKNTLNREIELDAKYAIVRDTNPPERRTEAYPDVDMTHSDLSLNNAAAMNNTPLIAPGFGGFMGVLSSDMNTSASTNLQSSWSGSAKAEGNSLSYDSDRFSLSGLSDFGTSDLKYDSVSLGLSGMGGNNELNAGFYTTNTGTTTTDSIIDLSDLSRSLAGLAETSPVQKPIIPAATTSNSSAALPDVRVASIINQASSYLNSKQNATGYRNVAPAMNQMHVNSAVTKASTVPTATIVPAYAPLQRGMTQADRQQPAATKLLQLQQMQAMQASNAGYGRYQYYNQQRKPQQPRYDPSVVGFPQNGASAAGAMLAAQQQQQQQHMRRRFDPRRYDPSVVGLPGQQGLPGQSQFASGYAANTSTTSATAAAYSQPQAEYVMSKQGILNPPQLPQAGVSPTAKTVVIQKRKPVAPGASSVNTPPLPEPPMSM